MSLHLYCRVSTTKQIEGLSLSIQGDESTVEELAKKYNTKVGSRVYQDEGKSAYKGMNLSGELGEFLNDIESGVVKAGDILVCRALDRLSRLSLTNALNVYGRIMEAGVCIHTTMDDRRYEPNDQLSQILATLAFNTANEESEKKSYLTNKYALTRIEQFYAGKRSDDGYSFDIGVGKHPWYFTLVDKVVKPNEMFSLARELVDLALDGKGISTCRKHAKERGLELSHSGMARFFKTPALYGDLTVKLEDKEATRKHPTKEKQYVIRELQGYYPAVCTKAEFLRIQKIKQLHADTTTDRKYNISLLAGAKRLYCHNGYSMIASTNKNVSYYRCGAMDCDCGSYIPQYSLNRMILETLQHHVFIPTEKEDNNQLLDLEIQLEQKTLEFKQRQRMVLDNPTLFDDEAMVKLAEDKAELERISSQLDAAREEQAAKLSYAGGLSLEHFNEWLQKTEQYLDSTDEDEIKEVRERVKSVVRRIDYNSGLVKVQLADGSTTMLYQPQAKDRRQRSYLQLQIMNESMKAGSVSLNPAMQYVCFTESELQEQKHVIKAEDYPTGLLKPCSKPLPVKDHKAEFLDLVREIKAVQWKRKPAMQAGIKDWVWQDFKDTDMSAEGFHVYDVQWKTKSYAKRSDRIVSVNEMTELDFKQLLNSPKIDHFEKI